MTDNILEHPTGPGQGSKHKTKPTQNKTKPKHNNKQKKTNIMKRSVESNDGSNVSNVSSNSEAKRLKLVYCSIDPQRLPHNVLHNGSIQEVVEKAGEYALQVYQGNHLSTGSFWLQVCHDDEDLIANRIANMEEWAVQNKQIFILEKKQDDKIVFTNIFAKECGVAFSLFLLPKSIKETLIEKDKAKKKRLEESKLKNLMPMSEVEWEKQLYKVAVDNDGQFVSRPLWKRSHDLDIGSFQEFLGTFWLLKEKEDVLKNRINNVQTWGISRIYTLKSVSDKGCCVLKNIHNDRVYRCDSIFIKRSDVCLSVRQPQIVSSQGTKKFERIVRALVVNVEAKTGSCSFLQRKVQKCASNVA